MIGARVVTKWVVRKDTTSGDGDETVCGFGRFEVGDPVDLYRPASVVDKWLGWKTCELVGRSRQ
jgi:hypothetical protein